MYSVPKLRFPEFKGEWENKKLGEIAKFSKGKGISKSEIAEDGKIECIRYGELYTRYGEVIDNVYSRTNIDLKNLVLSEANDVIIPASGETQIDIATASCVIKSDIALGGDLNIIKTVNNGVFLSYYLNNQKKNEIANLAQGISVVHLYSSQLATLSLNLPTLPEQTRIASFFTVLDKKIAELKQKKTLLEEYKKGVMQKIFSQELRFKDKDWKESPKWEKKKLGNIAEINPRSERLPEAFIYIDLESVVQGRLTKEDRINKLDAPSRAQRLLRKKDILFQMVRPYQKNNYFFDRNEKDFVASTGYAQIRTSENPEFLFQFLHEEFFVKNVIEKCTGTGYPSINSSDLSNIIISVPSDKEQTRIANFLSSVDEKINRTENQIQQTQQYKKGLLQKMFC